MFLLDCIHSFYTFLYYTNTLQLFIYVHMYQCVSCSAFHLCMCASHPSLQLCETSCVCLLYLVYLLQEKKLPAAAPSLHIHSVRLFSLPAALSVKPWMSLHSQVTFIDVVHEFTFMLCACGVICSIIFQFCLTGCAC